ncbi:MAG: hypothetical protein PUB12_00040 [[Clostridium] aminophilum]|uniref:hypothetical protein n=1 Tax=[Clostridium] aminophilum TaxID=1526 RepID=UPI0026F2A512|nr:hypothetical protein [[Clostridium] aminophilum]MDD6195287.1 hypothetical protein [[Clostridium] aminophilum]
MCGRKHDRIRGNAVDGTPGKADLIQCGIRGTERREDGPDRQSGTFRKNGGCRGETL